MATIKIDTNIIQTRPDGSHVIQLGDMEIWDGADLAMLRETLMHLYHKMRSRRFGVDMSYVKYVPSGFFGMLFDWHEKGVEIRLYSPQPHVARMLWFRRFFQPITHEAYLLNSSYHAAPSPLTTQAPAGVPTPEVAPQYQASN